MTTTLDHPATRDWTESAIDLRISVDPVLFTLLQGELHVLLRNRTWEPFRGVWALPGAINPPGEQIEETMWRELRRLGFSSQLWVEQLKTFDRPPQSIGGVTVPGRDPRGRVISVAYFATLPSCAIPPGTSSASSSEGETEWIPLSGLPSLAFDHQEIVDYALWRLRNKIQYAPVAFELLPPEFTLTDLQEVYEAVLGDKLDKRNFRRKVLKEKIVSPTQSLSRREKRPARLYRFDDNHLSHTSRSIKRRGDVDAASPDRRPRPSRPRFKRSKQCHSHILPINKC
jgi:8-oxo-dGTP diphosphatase